MNPPAAINRNRAIKLKRFNIQQLTQLLSVECGRAATAKQVLEETRFRLFGHLLADEYVTQRFLEHVAIATHKHQAGYVSSSLFCVLFCQ